MRATRLGSHVTLDRCLAVHPLILLSVGVLIAVAAVYANGLNGSFHYDDRETIVENPALRPSNLRLDSLASWWGADASRIGGGHYRPLTFVTYAFNAAIGGLDPFGYHVVNVALHWAVATALMALVWSLLPRPGPVALAGLFFALNPFNSEAVNYLSARSSLLASLFSCLAVVAFIRYRRLQTAERGGASAFMGGLALLGLTLALASKEIAVTVPLLWMAYDLGWSRRAPLRARQRSSVTLDARQRSSVTLERIVQPYVLVGALVAGYLWWTGYHGVIRMLLDADRESIRGFWPNLWTQIGLIPEYARLFVWPSGLSAFHDIRVALTPWYPDILAGFVVVGLIAGIGLRWLLARQATIERHARREATIQRHASEDLERRAVAFMLIWFPVTLIPVVVYPLVVMFQEHRGYFSVMGLAGALGIGVWRVGSAVTRPTARRLAAVGLGAVLVASALATVQRNAVWRDEISLWSDAAAKAPGGATGHINLGVGYLHAGDLGRAEASFRRALVVDPAHPLVYYNLGQVALRREHADEARAWFRRALALAPRSWEAHYALGEAEMAGGRLEDAATAFGQAVALNPRDAKAHVRLGVLAQQVGDDASAEAAYLTALRDDPDNPEVLNNLGAIYLGRREWARALDLLTTAVRRDPDYVDAAYNRALALDALGRTAEARTALLGVLDRLPVEPRFEPRRRAVLALLNEGGS